MTELNYKSSGVDLELYEQAMQKLPSLMQRTLRPGVMELPGGFAGLFRLQDAGRFEDPVLVSGTDGVGTKIKVALMAERYETIGIDLVAMCVNDCLCLGARPLFFLDYIAMGRDNPVLLEQLVRGVSEGCVRSESALLGGETAIMPDLYRNDDFDMAGFSVGVADRSALVNGRERVQSGDVLIGLPSSGFHSNGYSLIRKVVFEHAGLTVHDRIDSLDTTVADLLLTPTRIYARDLEAIRKTIPAEALHGIAHITGGGLDENVRRSLPEGANPEFESVTPPAAPAFEWLRDLGSLAEEEMQRVFNMGVGLVVIVPEEHASAVLQATLPDSGRPLRLGTVR